MDNLFIISLIASWPVLGVSGLLIGQRVDTEQITAYDLVKSALFGYFTFLYFVLNYVIGWSEEHLMDLLTADLRDIYRAFKGSR